MNKVLVVAVHPDDETIACGGTLLKHKANGDEIHWLICTETNKTDKRCRCWCDNKVMLPMTLNADISALSRIRR